MTHEIEQKESAAERTSEVDRWYRDRRAGLWDVVADAPFVAGEFGFGSPIRAARTDVSDTGTAFKIVAEVPGIPKEKIEIRVRGATVEIRGEHATDEKSAGEFVHRERRFAGYYRALELPEPVVAAEAKATVENGVLELDLPKLHPGPSNDEVRVPVA
jgi:HSP20 family protein